MQEHEVKEPADRVPAIPQKNAETLARENKAQRRAALNQAADQQLAQMGFRRAAGDRVWEMVNLTGERVAKAVAALPGVVFPYFQNDALMVKVKEQGNEPRLILLGGQLTRDVRQFHENRCVIHGMHSQRNGSSVDADDLISGMRISQEYIKFYDEYKRIVLPVLVEIMEILRQAGQDLSSETQILDQSYGFKPVMDDQ